ncbi:SGNH/GDSL hydrolase family protein [Leptolyngbyaceae cyanobacterium UHCC 1019]
MRTQNFVSQVYGVAIATSLPIALVALSPVVAEAIGFTNLYVFGDSLSDTGNLYRATGNLIPPPPYFNGRLSNGPLWVEYLAPKLNLTYTPQTNFAFAGATTGTLNTTLPGGVPGLQQEVNLFTTLNPVADPTALYIVWSGANDYLGGKQQNPAIPVSNLSTAIQSLAGVGAKNIVVANLPDLGKLPGTIANPQASAGLTALSGAHNSFLAQTLSLLSPSLSPSGVNLIPLDVNALFNDALTNPAKYGFTNTTESCISPPPLLNPGVVPTVCSNPREYVFWDDIHPTTATHAFIGELAFETVSNSQAIPEPSAVAGLFIAGAFVSLKALQQRQRQKAVKIEL